MTMTRMMPAARVEFVWMDRRGYKAPVGRALRRLLRSSGLPLDGVLVRAAAENVAVLEDPRKVQWWFHCTKAWTGLAERLLSWRSVWLVPGDINVHGLGIYGATAPQWSYGEIAIALRMVDIRKAGLTVKINTEPDHDTLIPAGLLIKPAALLELDGTNRVIVVADIVDSVELPVASLISQKIGLAQPDSADPADRRGRKGKKLSRAAVRRLERAANAAQAIPGLRYRALGLALGIIILMIAIAKAALRRGGWAKWLWLGLFMTGLGRVIGRIRLPRKWAARQLGANGAFPGNWKGVRRYWRINDNAVLVRPEPSTELFWMVGSFTVKAVRDSEGNLLAWRGEDVYDFHPQQGQRVAEDGHFCWAWSGVDKNDVTIILPGKVAKMVRRAAHHLFPKIWGRMVRLRPVDENQFRVLISNRLWPALGGKPFTTVVEVPATNEK